MVLSEIYVRYKNPKEISRENKVQTILSLLFLSFLWVDKTDHIVKIKIKKSDHNYLKCVTY